MTILAEPSVSLCGKRAENHYAVCVVDVKRHADRPCVFMAVVDAELAQSRTFTPAKWAVAPPFARWRP